MKGISGSGKDGIGSIIEEMFDNIAFKLLGNIPRLRNKKFGVISTEQNHGLSHLFVQAMQNKQLNEIEKDALKGLLVTADGYVESLKNKTKSNLTDRLDGLAKEASIRNEAVDQEDVRRAIGEEMRKALANLIAIAESESTKLRNIGTLMSITRMAETVGDNDPTVFFVPVRDGSTCKECIRLHCMPDGVTPKLWKFSDLKQGYHKRGENNPSAFGLHPHCRCTLIYYSKGTGFDAQGRNVFVDLEHDEYKKQNKI
jgi:hypothetical protein